MHEHDHLHHDATYDRLGLTLSAICVVHCVVSPFLALAFPFFAKYTDKLMIHAIMFLLVFPLALISFYSGAKDHQQWRPFKIGLIALAFLLIGLAVEYFKVVEHHHSHIEYMHEVMFHGPTIIGSLLLVTAHYLNFKMCRCKS